MRPKIKTNPEVLTHDLNQYFPELLKFESIEAAEKSAVYRNIRGPVIDILNSVVQEQFAVGTPNGGANHIKTAAWNIERGSHLDGIIDKLKNHKDLRQKDLYLLTELDHGMARSGNRFVAREIAQKLELNYAFAPVYIALQKGSGVEAEVGGENKNSIHGLALFSKYPLTNVHAIPLPNGKDKMIGKEKRLGYLRALIADVQHAAGTFRAVTVHLDVHCSRRHREMQIALIVKHLETLPRLPTIIGGDFNTTTFDAQNATRAIMGFWRRVLAGPKNMVANPLSSPGSLFRTASFEELIDYGFEYRQFNEEGVGTLHYDMENAAYNTNLGDWVPQWCFPFIFWASRKVGGKFSLRLDWFVGRNIDVAPDTKPKTIGNLKTRDGTPLSDHDAITLDFVLRKR